MLRSLLTPRDRPVFVKDMAYHATAFMNTEFVERFVNTFLIPHPRASLASLHARHSSFTLEEAGYEQLARLYDLASARTGTALPVVDADDLLDDPDGVMRAYCAAVGVDFEPDALSWRPREVPECARWKGWHDTAQRSHGLGRRGPQARSDQPDRGTDTESDGPTLSPRLESMVANCLPLYERLHLERPPAPEDRAVPGHWVLGDA